MGEEMLDPLTLWLGRQEALSVLGCAADPWCKPGTIIELLWALLSLGMRGGQCQWLLLVKQ